MVFYQIKEVTELLTSGYKSHFWFCSDTFYPNVGKGSFFGLEHYIGFDTEASREKIDSYLNVWPVRSMAISIPTRVSIKSKYPSINAETSDNAKMASQHFASTGQFLISGLISRLRIKP